MPKLMQKEIDKIKRKLLELAARVEDSVRLAVKSIDFQDVELAQKVIDGDQLIDEMEVDLEEDCLKVLALHQPVAGDLRFIVAVLKINNDLERIGDLSVNIAKRTLLMANFERMGITFNFPAMAELAQKMLKKSVDALVNANTALAYELWEDDDQVDEINREMYQRVQAEILKHPEKIECLIIQLTVSRVLERIADHTLHIAESVIYLVDGEIIRHKSIAHRLAGG